MSITRQWPGLFYDKGGAVYNVQHPDFGATGDGSTDDSTAIQAAVDACLDDGGGIVYIPPGEYVLGSTISIDTDESIQISGAGMGNVQTSDISGFGNAPTRLKYTGTDAAFNVNRTVAGSVTSSLVFSDFRLKLSGATASTYGIEFEDNVHSGTVVRRVHIVGPDTSHTAPLSYLGVGIYVGQNSQFLTIENSVLQYLDTGVYVYGFADFFRLFNTKIHRIQSNCLTLGDTASANVVGTTILISHSSFSQVVDGHLIFMRDPINIQIVYNHFESDTATATNDKAQIIVGTNTKAGDSETEEADGVVIANNWTNGNTVAKAFVELRRASIVTVRENVHRDFTTALIVSGDSSITTSEVIQLNVFDNVRRNGTYDEVDSASNATDLLSHHRRGIGNRGYDFLGKAATNEMIRSYVAGESDPRHAIRSDGRMLWGDGTAAADVIFYRNAASELRTDGKLLADAGIGVGNAAANTNTPGGATSHALEVFDENGDSLGFVPVYSAQW